ncbi:reverse transcriptase domain-containing protein, partial [Nonomuraea sp. NPDC046802]|uniref:reverse transcriptase domain-containing protein n=1 Tax=Nonomuraea sp. NPDC046802 TaxID=3154919 RepID=UPI0033E33337
MIADRCHQGRVRNALEPEWESRFDPKSYGFRPGRSCHDAIGAIFQTCCSAKTKRVWALDADLAAAFDKIDHTRLLEAIGSFPAKDLIREWLKSGLMEAGKGFTPTIEGTATRRRYHPSNAMGNLQLCHPPCRGWRCGDWWVRDVHG